MIVVEGPDGAGKTTLIRDLSALLNIPVAPRVVSQETKAMVDLRQWTEDNVSRGFRSDFLFDRHRLISDPIYRFIVPNKKMDAELYNLDWYYKHFFLFAQCRPLVI
ncbi:MAG: hypothetical protein LC650_01700, partial [Actinobacteria bacterium]|nr:hypothetical protein [Actinomycetota bacterium]